MLQPGDDFAEDYEILDDLGSGGFASVYRARQRSTGRDVAIKILELQDQITRDRFRLEASLLQKLTDPTIVELIDHGIDDGVHFLVLEFIEGHTLRELITREGALGPRRTVALLEKITTAVATAHAAGALHRDLKPENVMIVDGDDEAVKVLDFGVAKIVSHHNLHSTTGPMTELGTTVGTPRYMSPEALCGDPPSPASDVFSLGMLAFEMLTGERALPNLAGNELVSRMVDDEPIPIPERVPEELRTLLTEMLAKRAENRIDSAPRLLVRLGALPQYEAKTRVMMPDEFATMRAAHSEAPNEATAPAESEPLSEPTVTSEEVRAAARRVREDAQARAEPQWLGEHEPSDEQQAQPRRTHAKVAPPPQTPPELDRPPPKRRRLDLAWRQVLGFGILAVAVVLAVGYFTGVVGIKVAIVDGHPLECGFGRSSIHIERHFELFGMEIVRLDHEIRCTDGPR